MAHDFMKALMIDTGSQIVEKRNIVNVMLWCCGKGLTPLGFELHKEYIDLLICIFWAS